MTTDFADQGGRVERHMYIQGTVLEVLRDGSAALTWSSDMLIAVCLDRGPWGVHKHISQIEAREPVKCFADAWSGLETMALIGYQCYLVAP